MKFKILFHCLFFFSVIFCSAQKKFSLSSEAKLLFLPKVEGGRSFNHLISAEKKSGYGGTLFINYHFSKSFSISSGLEFKYLNFHFINLGWGISNWNFDNKIRCKDYGIPLLINGFWNTNKYISFLFSSGFSFSSYSSIASTVDVNGTTADNPDLSDKYGFGLYIGFLLNIGLSYKLNNSISIISKGGIEFLSQGIKLNDENYISGKIIKNVNLGLVYRLGKKE